MKNNKTKSQITLSSDDDSIISEPSKVANTFNNFFSTIGSSLQKKIIINLILIVTLILTKQLQKLTKQYS